MHAIREVEHWESKIPSMTGQSASNRISNGDGGEVALLTLREVQVLRLAARGLSNRDIGAELEITTRTVKGHLMNIYSKMKVKSRTEAVSHALKEGWVTLEDIG